MWHYTAEFVSVEGGDLDSATTGTWVGKIPASLPPALPPSSDTPPTAKSPTKAKETSAELSHKVKISIPVGSDDHFLFIESCIDLCTL